MRLWQFWWHTIAISSQQNPPRFVELVMLMLAMALVVIWLIFSRNINHWPFLVLGLSYVIGASSSMLVREAFLPSSQPRITQLMAILLLIISLYGLADLAYSL
ncbi:MAG: hypothetical protein SAL07_04590 [Oscillatoria sp. PMC 1051.18]|uniref:hypothetical protein n=1 Tax=Oscillatoria salina TaxID=331517 RepID=UPI0013BBE316|nr:hypothetical protein [Oscillatoria salina]MBZ8180156.1 hypothetical protein [Oscillatoria salina IIICB1]MEC4892656.1 hypothetical protein [Oscillatoria sp. PMC 1050.18]MEC5029170.1 hypothetical protein [Oscillatoria sp. PMC 1051.18]NET88607.1 hypothetical protein [Kamptonema sp. SIO1D9]